MRGTAAELLAQYLLHEKGYDVADVVRSSAAQDLVIRLPGAAMWQGANVKRAYRKADGFLTVNTEHRDGSKYRADEIDYILAVLPPTESPAYWADIWLIPFAALVHAAGPLKGHARGRIRLTDKWEKYKI